MHMVEVQGDAEKTHRRAGVSSETLSNFWFHAGCDVNDDYAGGGCNVEQGTQGIIEI